MTTTRCPRCFSEDIVGMEVLGVYSGSLFWMCLNTNCHFAWPRAFPVQPKYQALSKRYATEYNKARGHA